MPKKCCLITINYLNQSKQNLAFLIGYDLEPFLNVSY